MREIELRWSASIWCWGIPTIFTLESRIYDHVKKLKPIYSWIAILVTLSSNRSRQDQVFLAIYLYSTVSRPRVCSGDEITSRYRLMSTVTATVHLTAINIPSSAYHFDQVAAVMGISFILNESDHFLAQNLKLFRNPDEKHGISCRQLKRILYSSSSLWTF